MPNVTTEWYSGSGKGGQHRNKHANCCRVRHAPTGLTAVGQSSKSRKTNQREAMATLAKRVREYYNPKSDKRQEKSGERVRTYHVERSQMIDHASGHKVSCDPVSDDQAFATCINARRAVVVRQA